MRRVPPSMMVREEIDRLLAGGVDGEANIVSELADLGLRYLAQQGLEQELRGPAPAPGRHWLRDLCPTGSTHRSVVIFTRAQPSQGGSGDAHGAVGG